MAKKPSSKKGVAKKTAANSKKITPVANPQAAAKKVSAKPAAPVAISKITEPTPKPTVAALSPAPPTPKTVPLAVSVQSSQGAAANGNTHPANLLIIVTSGGWPVTELDKNHFTIMEHFEVPGQTAPFSNNISSFRNAGTGAYLIQTKPINGASWRSGHHLGQILVSTSDDQQGQAAFKLVIR